MAPLPFIGALMQTDLLQLAASSHINAKLPTGQSSGPRERSCRITRISCQSGMASNTRLLAEGGGARDGWHPINAVDLEPNAGHVKVAHQWKARDEAEQGLAHRVQYRKIQVESY